MALEGIIRNLKHYSVIALASLAFSCSGCDDDKLSVSPCIEYEICGNRNEQGRALDDNCNGRADEGCDEDGDGYCGNKEIIYQQGIVPTVCIETFSDCLKFPDQDCKYFKFDCDDKNSNINHGVTEICDGINNNCKDGIDESFPEQEKYCDIDRNIYDQHKELDGICELATPVCIDGSIECPDAIGPRDREYCNKGIDDDCNPETTETFVTDAVPCYTGPPGTAGVGACMGGVSLCLDGVIDLEACFADTTPIVEECNCIDDDCDGETDEGVTNPGRNVLGSFVDNSSSMRNFYQILLRLANFERPLFCAIDDRVLASIVTLGDPFNRNPAPVVKASMVHLEEFVTILEDNISLEGTTSEPSGNSLVYAVCDLLERSFVYEPICDYLIPFNTLRPDHPRNHYGPVLGVDANNVIVQYTDEPYAWRHPAGIDLPPDYHYSDFPYVNQEEASLLAQRAGVKVIIYTRGKHNHYGFGTFSRDDGGGWAYFEDNGGEVRDINQLNEPEDTEKIIKGLMCIDEN